MSEVGASGRAAALARHDLVWLERAPGPHRMLHDVAPAHVPLALDWFARGFPAVVRRSATGEGADGVTLGIPLPPAQGRARISLRVDPAGVRVVRHPPDLDEVIGVAPASWRTPLARLAGGARDLGVALHVYGSLLWQHLTGLPYVTETSDVDLLFRVHDPRQLASVLQLLTDWQRTSGLRADGELLLAGGLGIAWRELLGDSPQVLVKSRTAPALLTRAELMSRLCAGGT